MKVRQLPQRLVRRLKTWRDERGNVAIIFALATPVLVGGAGLAVETSFDYVSQNHVQSAADAAAYAAGLELMAGSNSQTINSAAAQQASANGWQSANGSITVNTPPSSGPNAGQANAVEVQLTQNVPKFFSAIFGGGTVTTRGRSVVITQTASNACILALDKTANAAISVQGNSLITLGGCDVMSNSISSSAINVWGSGQLTADCAVSAGGVTNHGGLTMTGCASAVTQAPRVPDPFAALATPAQGQNRSIPNSKNGVTLSPGYYSSGMDLKGNVTLNPGTYYVAGGDFHVNANANVSGQGVTIYLASGAHVDMNGNATVTMSAPTSGTYSGILFFGDRNGSGSNTFNGNANSNLTGDLYFPSEAVNYLGNFSGTNGCTQIVADTVSWSGDTSISVNCASQGMTPIPARQAVKMVE